MSTLFERANVRTRGKDIYVKIPEPIARKKKIDRNTALYAGQNDQGHMIVLVGDEWGRYLEEIPEEPIV